MRGSPSKHLFGRPAAAALVFACLLLLASGEVGAQDGSTASIARAKNDVIGASITYPAKWSVEREPYTFDETYGFTLWKPDSDAPHDHGGRPAVRVALAYDLRPGQIKARVREKLAAYPDLPMVREEVSVAGKGHKGVAVGPIPGSTPSTEVYVPVNGRVYQINVYGEKLGADGKELLSALRFKPPSRTVRSLGLPDANAPKVLYATGDPELLQRERAARGAAAAPGATFEASALSGARERRIAEGCWRADLRFFFQTQHGMYANSNPGDGIPTGWTIVGKPNYWNEYTHGRLGYGRCIEPEWCNDKFAVDYPLDSGDAVFSPFRRGTVTFAGRNYTHKDYGIFVSIRASNGKYVSLSAHLSALKRGIKRGAKVTDKTIIGFAGKTGGGRIPVGYPHLHQAYYRFPSYSSDGSPYGGAGLQVVRHHYVGTAARTSPGVYRFGWEAKPGIKAKGDRISN